jgi:hypothetical protein
MSDENITIALGYHEGLAFLRSARRVIEEVASVDAELKIIGTIDLGGAKAQLLEDLSGRRCLSMSLGGHNVLFTASHALLVREILDHGLPMLLRYTPEQPPPPTEEKSP